MTLEYRTSRVTSNVNNGLSVVMMCQCRFILGKKTYHSRRNMIVGEAVKELGQGEFGKSFSVLPKFAVNLKFL